MAWRRRVLIPSSASPSTRSEIRSRMALTPSSATLAAAGREVFLLPPPQRFQRWPAAQQHPPAGDAPSAAAMGMLYTGAMDKGQMHGKGSLVYQNNEKYEGDFEHGTTYHAAHGAGPALDLGH